MEKFQTINICGKGNGRTWIIASYNQVSSERAYLCVCVCPGATGLAEGAAAGGQGGGLHAGGGRAERLGEEGPGEGQHAADPGHHREGSAGSEQVEGRRSLHSAKTQ